MSPTARSLAHLKELGYAASESIDAAWQLLVE